MYNTTRVGSYCTHVQFSCCISAVSKYKLSLPVDKNKIKLSVQMYYIFFPQMLEINVRVAGGGCETEEMARSANR